MATNTKGTLTHNYKCAVCGTFYSWGQSNALMCNFCNTLFVPYIDQTLYNEAYKDKYVQYQQSDINAALQKIRWNNVSKYKNSGSLLDYGCGSGAFLKAAPTKWEVCGTEINKHCLTHCNESGLNTLELSESLERKWDVVTMFDVLEHLPNLNVLNDIRDSLNNGGLLVIATPNLTEQIGKDFNSWRHYRPYGEHTFYFSLKSLTVIADVYDFQILEVNDNESTIRPPAGNIATYVLKKA